MALSHSYDLKIKKRIGFVVRLVREILGTWYWGLAGKKPPRREGRKGRIEEC